MSKFRPPVRQEVITYAKRLGYKTFDYNIWFAYYEVRNWIPKGSTKQMSSWQAAVRTWFYTTDEYKALKTQRNQPKPKSVVKKNFVPATEKEKREIKKKMAHLFKKVEPETMTDSEFEDMRQKKKRALFSSGK